jgi:hypothetical protein
MKNGLVRALILATILTSSSAVLPAPVEKPFNPPEKIHMDLKGKGVRYDTVLTFDYNGQQVIATYHVIVNWQNLFGDGNFDMTRGDYIINGKEYSSDGKEIHH